MGLLQMEGSLDDLGGAKCWLAEQPWVLVKKEKSTSLPLQYLLPYPPLSDQSCLAHPTRPKLSLTCVNLDPSPCAPLRIVRHQHQSFFIWSPPPEPVTSLPAHRFATRLLLLLTGPSSSGPMSRFCAPTPPPQTTKTAEAHSIGRTSTMRTRRQAASTAEPSSEAESTCAPDLPAGSTAVAKADRRAKESQSPALQPSPDGNGPKIPQALQFPLVVVLSFLVSSLGYQATYPWTKAVLADHARMLDSLTEVALLTGWKM